MSQDEKNVTAEAKQRRSPISPMIAIDEAIQKARLIYAKDKRAFTDFKTISEHIGYKVKYKGGTAGRALSALKQYGLLDEKGGQYRISEAAWKILEMEEGSEERKRLIKEAALRPPMIRRILGHYDGELPSDATLRNHLLFTEGFNTDTASNFIRVLRRTIELVNPASGDYNAGEESEGAGELPFTGATPMQQTPPFTGHPKPEVRQAFNPTPQPTPHAAPVPPPADGFQFQISERSVNVLFNGVVTQEAIKKLIKYLEISVDDFPSKKELEQAKSRAEVGLALEETERELNEGAE